METEDFQLCASIVRSSAIGMIVVAPSSRILLVNLAFSEILGKSASDILGTSVEQHTTSKDIPVYGLLLKQLAAIGTQEPGAMRVSLPHSETFKHANRTSILCTGAASLIHGDEGPALLYSIDHHKVVVASGSERFPQAAINTAKSRTILIVEDDALVRKSTRRVLMTLGYNVLQASNGIEALAAIDRHTGLVDVVITDVVMPKMNGAQLASQLAKRCPNQRVLFVSGHTEETIGQGGLLPRGACFLQKPFGTRELIDTLASLLQ